MLTTSFMTIHSEMPVAAAGDPVVSFVKSLCAATHSQRLPNYYATSGPTAR